MFLRIAAAFLAVAMEAAWAQHLPDAALVSSAFVGVEEGPGVSRLVVDAVGNRYVLWRSESPQPARDFVAKLRPDGSTVWTYFSVNESISALTVDSAGNVTIAGESISNQQSYGYLRRLDTSMGAPAAIPAWNLRITGIPRAISSDSVGNIYAAGQSSPDFQGTPGSVKPRHGEPKCSVRHFSGLVPCLAVFVTKISPEGRTIYATLIGGSYGETASAIAIGADGSAYIVGTTTSPDFPITAGVGQPNYGGTLTLGPVTYGDGFAVRLDPSGERYVFSTYVRTELVDDLLSIAVDRTNGLALAVGRTHPVFPQAGDRLDPTMTLIGPSGQFLSNLRLLDDRANAAVSASISPDGRYFVGLSSNEIMELSREGLTPTRRTRHRVDAAPGIVALANGSVIAVSTAGNPREGVFAVPHGKQAVGSAYIAEYHFDRPAEAHLTAIVNAASFVQGRRSGNDAVSIAPNEWITIFGDGLSGQAQVSLGGRELVLSYADTTQINALVPHDVLIGTHAEIVVRTGTLSFGPYQVEIAPVVPGLFMRQSGDLVQTAAALNQDGAINSREHPAAPGSVVALFGTGLGRLNSANLLAEAFELYGPGGPGGGMEVLYAGAAPTLPGVQQLNVRIHPGASGASPPQPHLIRVAFGESGHFEYSQDFASVWVGTPVKAHLSRQH